MGLKIKPEINLHIEKAPKSDGSVGADCPPAVYDLVNSTRCYANIFGQAILADSQGYQEFLQKDFAGMDGGKITFFHDVTFQW